MTALLVSLALLQPPGRPAPADDWQAAEHKHLTNVRQVTTGFVRAGEGYFSPDGKRIIYQAEEKGTGNPFYQIFVQDLATGSFRRISPGVGRTTCAYFHPTKDRVMFASGHTDPEAKKHQAEEVARRADEAAKGVRRRYSWDFDPFMKIYEADPDGSHLVCLTLDAKAYTAEGSYSADGKRIVYASGNAGDVQIYVADADGKNAKAITTAKNCYNGGPFLSPDGTKVVFRSDRKEKDRLQLYVVNADGTGEKALTNDDKWVYWAPYWYADNKHVIYTAADHGDESKRPNYDLYWMRVLPDENPAKTSENKENGPRGRALNPGKNALPGGTSVPDSVPAGKPVRLTFNPGQDVLPVFSPDGKKVMWTSSRGGGGGTQLWIADFTPPKD